MPDDLRYDIVNRRILELEHTVRQLTTQSTLGNASITRGRLRVASNEGLLVQGSQKVEGWLVVTGTERVTGTLEVQGRLVASGAIELTGPTSIAGDTDITGHTSITGDADVLGDLTIRDGGRAVVTGPDGDTVLDASKMTFANGSTVDANGGSGAAIRAGAYVVVAQSGIASLGTTGRRFEVDGFYDGPRAVGMATIPKSQRPNNEIDDVVAGPDGVFRRVVAI